ncbi:hypothetical protein JZU48_04015, partial [bacterium]|nr:hypothetical protein [bacterium]
MGTAVICRNSKSKPRVRDHELLADPFIQSSALPLLLGLALTGALRLAAGPRAAAGGIAAAFLVLFIWVVGLPALPPPSGLGKLFWSAVAGLVLGLALDAFRAPPPLRGGLVLLWLAGSLAWIAAASLSAATDWAAFGLALTAAIWTALAPAPGG